MPAVSAVSILAMSGRSELEAGERVRAAGEIVEGDQRAALAVLGDHLLQQLAVRAALGLDELEADPRRVGAEAADDRPRGAHRALDVQDRARVEVDEQDLAAAAGAACRPRAPRCGRGSRRRRARRGPRRRRSARRRAARPCRASRASAPRGRRPGRRAGRRSAGSAASSGRARGTRGTSRCACGPAASRPGPAGPLVGQAHREQARALGDRERLDDRLQPLVPARAGQQQTLARRYRPRRARRRGARPCRAPTAGARAGARRPWRRWRGSRPGDRLKRRRLYSPSVVDRTFVGRLDRRRRTPRAPSARAHSDVQLVGEVGQHQPLRARLRARARRPRAASGARARRRLGLRQRRLDQQQVGAGGERRTASCVGPAVGGEREPRAVARRTRPRWPGCSAGRAGSARSSPPSASASAGS